MSTDLERDLGAWTSGELSRDRLLATHGDAAAGLVALHERLAGVAASASGTDADAGWAALLVAMDAPAQVVPLRRHVRRRRTVAILVAAALVFAGTAFAATLGLGRRDAPPPPAGTTAVEPAAGGNSTVGTNDRRLVPPPSVQPAGTGGSGQGPSSDGGTATGDGAGTQGGSTPTATDDPHDRDHGTGNDGSHDDKGGGNDGSTGTLPRGSSGHGH